MKDEVCLKKVTYLTRANEFQTICLHLPLLPRPHTPSSDLKVFCSLHSWCHLSSCYWTTPNLTLVNKLNRFLFTSHCLLTYAPRTPLYNCQDGKKGKGRRRRNQSLPSFWRYFWSTAVLPSCIWTHPTYQINQLSLSIEPFLCSYQFAFFVCLGDFC